jgi:hypothetical protein
VVRVAAAQLGPIARDESRESVIDRLLTLLRGAHAQGAELVVYPELALTTFFPRWYFDDQADIDAFFEREMPSAATKPLFDGRKARRGFCLGCQITRRTSPPPNPRRARRPIVGKYRKSIFRDTKAQAESSAPRAPL